MERKRESRGMILPPGGIRCYSQPMKLSSSLAVCVSCALGWAGRADAVMFLESGDPAHHASTPGDNSGWQYGGKFMTFLGVPIAPHFFITAKHIGGSVGTVFDFHGDSYTTIAYHDSPSTDLRIWEVNHSKPFPTYAPLSSGALDVGSTATIFGRGTQRGVEVIVSGESKGWKWGPGDDVKRWGRNVIEGTLNAGPLYGELIYCNFDDPGVSGECHLSTGDSGGGVFVLENGLWRLAGINLSVDGPFRLNNMNPQFYAALYDVGGLEYYDGTSWIPVPEGPADVQSSFYCSRISASTAWITGIAPDSLTLASENYAAWQTLYFSPAQIATPSTTGPLADFDADGISNLLEFALNLDPIFNERVTMDPGTGLRGLPLVRVENISGNDRVTIEFVRRTAASGAGLTCTPQFSDDMQTWSATGTATVTSINPRWDRVKVVDSQNVSASAKRFARLKVEQ